MIKKLLSLFKTNTNYPPQVIPEKAATVLVGLEDYLNTNKTPLDDSHFSILHFEVTLADQFKSASTIKVYATSRFGGFDYINNSGMPKMLGKHHSQKTKDRLSEVLIERRKNGTAPKMTEEVRKNISEAKLGSTYKSRPSKSAEHKEKLRIANLGKQHSLIACPQCGKQGGERAIKRWHRICAGVTQW